MPKESEAIVSLWCENCGKPCKPMVCWNDYVGSACCQSYLLRRVTDKEEGDILADLDADEPRSAAENARAKVMGGV